MVVDGLSIAADAVNAAAVVAVADDDVAIQFALRRAAVAVAQSSAQKRSQTSFYYIQLNRIRTLPGSWHSEQKGVTGTLFVHISS